MGASACENASGHGSLGPRQQKPPVKPTVPPRRNQPPPLPERSVGVGVKPVPQPRTHRPPPSAPSPSAPPPLPTPTPPVPSPSPPTIQLLPTNHSEVTDLPSTRLEHLAENNFVAAEPVKQSPLNPFKCSDLPEPEIPNPIINNPFNPFNDVIDDLAIRPVPQPPPSNPENAIDSSITADDSTVSPAARIDLVVRPVPTPPVVEPVGQEDLMNRPVPQPPPSTGSSVMPAMEPEILLMDTTPPPLPLKKKKTFRSTTRDQPPPLPSPAREEETPPVSLPVSIKEENTPMIPVPTPRTSLVEEDTPPIPARPTPIPVPDIPARENPSTEMQVVDSTAPDSPPDSPPPNNPPPSIPPPPLPSLPPTNPISNVKLLETVLEQNGNYESGDFSLPFPMQPTCSTNQEQNSHSLDSSRKSDHSSRSSQEDTLMVPSTHSESDPNMSTESDQIMNIIEGYSQSDIMAPGEEEYQTLDSSLIHEEPLGDPSNIGVEQPDTNSIYGVIWEDANTAPPLETETQVTPFKKPQPLLSEEDDYLPSWECETGQARPASILDPGMPRDPPPPVPQSTHPPISQGIPPTFLQGMPPLIPESTPPPVPQSTPPPLRQSLPPSIPQVPARVLSTPPSDNSHQQAEATCRSSGPPIPVRRAPPPPGRENLLQVAAPPTINPMDSSEYEAILAFTTDDDSKQHDDAKQDAEDAYDMLTPNFPPIFDRPSSTPSLAQDDVPEIPFKELSQHEDSDDDESSLESGYVSQHP